MAKKQKKSYFIKSCLEIAKEAGYKKILWVFEDLPPFELINKLDLKGSIIFVSSNTKKVEYMRDKGYSALEIPISSSSRMDNVNNALTTAISEKLVQRNEEVLIMTGIDIVTGIDTVLRVTAKKPIEDRLPMDILGEDVKDREQVNLILRILVQTAVEIGHDGYEGSPVGTIIVFGDSINVMEKSHQLTFNPFQGYPESERNVLKEDVRLAIKCFATLDGAFVIREDGTILAAARYLNIEKSASSEVKSSRGTRHLAAASITSVTSAIAIVVSQTTGDVTIYKNGKVVGEVFQKERRISVR